MTIALTDDHLELARIARSALEGLGGRSPARASLDAPADGSGTLALAARLGWLGLHLPEEHGGQGGGLPELVVVLAELGRVVAPGPVLTTVLASAVLDACGTEEQRRRWLPDLASGATRAAVGLAGGLVRVGAGVDGDAGAVLGADEADVLLLTVGADLVVVRADATAVEAHRETDPTRALCAVACAGTEVLDVLTGAAGRARELAVVLASAEAVGAMTAVTELAVDYVKVREQFGRPVGSFMAVKHHCAGMLVDGELSTAAVWDAARTSGSTAEDELAACVAGAVALPALLRLARLALQLHGGIAFTWEHDVHLFLRRAMSLAAAFDRPDHLRQRVTELTRAGVGRHATLDLPPEAEAHREQARAFVDSWFAQAEDERLGHLVRSGYLVPHWPAPWGRGAGPVEQLVLDEELAAVDRPSLGLGQWVLPAILQVGTPEQVERWMGPALMGRTRWCQLFSEPGAGSDAAAISTRATRVEGGWRLDGQKVWSSDAQHSTWGLATVRTDPTGPRHAGITTVAVDMTAPGLTVRPLREITGDSLFNEVFFDGVFVPDADVVGAVGGGWKVVIATLGFERVSIGGDVTSLPARDLVPLLDRHCPGDTGLAREVGALIAQSQALTMLNLRSATRSIGRSTPGAEGTVTKLVGAEHQQQVTELGLRIAGPAALVGGEPRLLRDSLYTRCLTIAGGTSEIVRTAIAERILGLPREQRIT